MKINSIENKNTQFTALKQVRPGYNNQCFTNDERIIVDKLKQYASESNFFKKNNVNAFVYTGCRRAVIQLNYHKIGEKTVGFFEKIKKFFSPKDLKTCMLVSNDKYCNMDAVYKMAKVLRDSSENHSLDSIIEKSNWIDIEKIVKITK